MPWTAGLPGHGLLAGTRSEQRIPACRPLAKGLSRFGRAEPTVGHSAAAIVCHARLARHPTRLGRRDHGAHLVRVRALLATAVNGGGHIEVGLSRLDRTIRIAGGEICCRIDPSVGPSCRGTAVNVVALYAGRACTPGKCDTVLLRRRACSGQGLDSRRTRSVADKRHIGRCRAAGLRRESHGERCRAA